MLLTRKSRPLMVLNYYSLCISGISEYARLMVKTHETEYDVTVLTGMHEAGLREYETIDGVRVVRAGSQGLY